MLDQQKMHVHRTCFSHISTGDQFSSDEHVLKATIFSSSLQHRFIALTMTSDEEPKTKVDKSKVWISSVKLIFLALPGIVFGIFTVVFTVQQDQANRRQQQLDRQQAEELNQRLTYNQYINDAKTLLLNRNFDRQKQKTLRHLRALTLTVLQNLDVKRKHDVILYLYENELLNSLDERENIIDLRRANLDNIRFSAVSTGHCYLRGISFVGIHAENITFDGCSLLHADFDETTLINVKFQSCQLSMTKFRQAILTGATFQDNIIYGTNFSGSHLLNSEISGGTHHCIDLSNVDLYQSRVPSSMFEANFNGEHSNIFFNSRYPNGTILSHDYSFHLIRTGTSFEVCFMII